MLEILQNTHNKINLEIFTIKGLINTIYEDPLRFKDKNVDPDTMLTHFSLMSLAYFQITDLVSYIQKMRQMCLDEIDGTYFEKHEKDIFDLEEQPNPDDYTIYSSILLNIKEGTYNITKPIEVVVEKIDQKDLAMQRAFTKFFPTVSSYKEQDGEMIELENEELEAGILSKAYSIQNYIFDNHSKQLEKIKNICESKGNVGEIIKIIDCHEDTNHS